ncbi:MAG: hypothetical protein ABSA30_06395 [Candidatus Aminicenantales bacterium]
MFKNRERPAKVDKKRAIASAHLHLVPAGTPENAHTHMVFADLRFVLP